MLALPFHFRALLFGLESTLSSFQCRIRLLLYITLNKYLGSARNRMHVFFCHLQRQPSCHCEEPLPRASFLGRPLGAATVYVHKNQISVFVICNSLSFFILYMSTAVFLHIWILFIYFFLFFLAEVRALLLRQPGIFWLQFSGSPFGCVPRSVILMQLQLCADWQSRMWLACGTDKSPKTVLRSPAEKTNVVRVFE